MQRAPSARARLRGERLLSSRLEGDRLSGDVNRGSSVLKTSLYWLLFIGCLGLAAWRGALAFHWLREWEAWRIADPSAAELYEVNFWFEIGWTLMALVFAAAGVVLLRKQRRVRRSREGL